MLSTLESLPTVPALRGLLDLSAEELRAWLAAHDEPPLRARQLRHRSRRRRAQSDHRRDPRTIAAAAEWWSGAWWSGEWYTQRRVQHDSPLTTHYSPTPPHAHRRHGHGRTAGEPG